MIPESENSPNTFSISVPRILVAELIQMPLWLWEEDPGFEVRLRIAKQLHRKGQVSLSVKKGHGDGRLRVCLDSGPVRLASGLINQPDLHFGLSLFVPINLKTNEATGEVTSDLGSVMKALLGGQPVELRASDKESPEIVRS